MNEVGLVVLTIVSALWFTAWFRDERQALTS